jgi:hypothetical protein
MTEALKINLGVIATFLLRSVQEDRSDWWTPSSEVESTLESHLSRAELHFLKGRLEQGLAALEAALDQVAETEATLPHLEELDSLHAVLSEALKAKAVVHSVPPKFKTGPSVTLAQPLNLYGAIFPAGSTLYLTKKQDVGWIIAPDGSHAESVIPATARAQLGLGGGR